MNNRKLQLTATNRELNPEFIFGLNVCHVTMTYVTHLVITDQRFVLNCKNHKYFVPKSAPNGGSQLTACETASRFPSVLIIEKSLKLVLFDRHISFNFADAQNCESYGPCRVLYLSCQKYKLVVFISI